MRAVREVFRAKAHDVSSLLSDRTVCDALSLMSDKSRGAFILILPAPRFPVHS